MTRAQLNTYIDTNITNKTAVNSLTPVDEGNALREVANYVDQQDALNQLLVNKSTDVTTDGASDTKYPSVKAVKTYVDANVGAIPTFQEITDNGGNVITDAFGTQTFNANTNVFNNIADGKSGIYVLGSFNISDGTNSQNVELPTTLTGGIKTITFPNSAGTVALTTDVTLQKAITGGSSITDGTTTMTVLPDSIKTSDFLGGKIELVSTVGSNPYVKFGLPSSAGKTVTLTSADTQTGSWTVKLPDAGGTVALKTYKIWRAIINYNSVVRVLIDEIGFTSPTITNPFNGVVYVTKAGFFTSLDPNKLEFISTNLNNSGQVFVTLVDQGGGVNPNNEFQVNIYDMTGGQTGTPSGNVTVEIRIYA